MSVQGDFGMWHTEFASGGGTVDVGHQMVGNAIADVQDASKSRIQGPRAPRQREGLSFKRSKIAQACEQCRARKVRCDGAQPVCSSCRGGRRRNQRPCFYNVEGPPSSAAHLGSSESKLLDLNESKQNGSWQWPSSGDHVVQPSASHRRAHSISNNTNSLSHPPHENTSSGTWRPNEPAEITFNNPANDDRSNPSESQAPFPESSSELDAMGTIGTAENTWDRRGSSAATFVEQVKVALAAKLSSPSYLDVSPGKQFPLLHDGVSMTQALMLPSRRVADEMMTLYWKEVHVLYPFLLPTQFMESYRRLWINELEESKERNICALLNIIFAICCRMSRAESKDEEAEMYFQRTVKLVQLEMLGQGSVELIQTLLLLVLYLQSTKWQHSCWVVTGLAIRFAQGMDLHLPETSARSQTQAEQQLARRLWHGCVLVDRIISMTLGRPQNISQDDATAVPLPAAIDDDHLSAQRGKENLQPLESPSTVNFYLETLKLFTIQTKTLSQMYPYYASRPDKGGLKAATPQTLEGVEFGTIITLDSELQEWKNGLPDHLNFRSQSLDTIDRPVFIRQANILHLRLLQARILLLRPVVSLLMTQESRTAIARVETNDDALPLWLTMARACAKNCICAAQSVIELLYNKHAVDTNQPLNDLLPAWWFELFFLYTAATAIIPARAFSHVRGSISPSSLAESWHHALEVLSLLSERSSTAKRCLAVLQCIGENAVTLDDMDMDIAHGNDPNAQTDGGNFDSFQQSNSALTAASLASQNPIMDLQNLWDVTGTEGLLDFAWLDSLPTGLDPGYFQMS